VGRLGRVARGGEIRDIFGTVGVSLSLSLFRADLPHVTFCILSRAIGGCGASACGIARQMEEEKTCERGRGQVGRLSGP